MAFAAGVVLAGGRSSRMGSPKAALEWHGSTLLRRVTGVVARSVDGPVVVVRAPGQKLPDLGPGVEVHDDPEEGLGPMQGLAVGLAAVAGRAEVAFVCSTDLPFLHSAFVRAVLEEFAPDAGAESPDVVLPVVHGFPQPMAAGYRVSVLPEVQALLAARRLRPAFLFEECVVRRLGEEQLLANPVLAAADPDLDSVLNVNQPDEYGEARARPAPEVVVETFGVLATAGGPRGPRRVRAATLSAAAAEAGLALDGHVLAALNGDQIARDGDLPLLPGDAVSFISADAGG